MGDEWEEQRLDLRDQFQKKLRLILDPEISDSLLRQRELSEVLTNELLAAVKLLKSALKEVTASPTILGSETLRVAYTRIASDPALATSGIEIQDSLEAVRGLSQAFGHAISSIMTINRCVLSLNSVKLEHATLIGVVTSQASAHAVKVGAASKTSSAARELSDQALVVELSSGEPWLLPLTAGTKFTPLQPVSMDLTLDQLSEWKAIDPRG